MTRRELVRRLVLNQICDDFENLDQRILWGVAAHGARCGLNIERTEVVDASVGLIADGLAKAYRLSSNEPHQTELLGMPPLDVIEDDFKTYFTSTKKGTVLQVSDSTWYPFREDGNLRPDWRLDDDPHESSESPGRP